MFGASSFGGFGQQNQQGMSNPSQPGTGGGGMFGQPVNPTGSAFGTPAFGQPAQTSATPAFGASTQTPAFGATPSVQQPQMSTPFSFNQPSSSTFGAPKPATTGFGSFGAASTQPTTSFGFGGATSTPAQPPTTSAFGSMQPSTGFGQNNTTSFFGQQPTTTFGGFGANTSMGGPQTVTQGSATVPYTPFREDMTPNEPKPHAKTFEVHQSLTSMPAYQNISPEELRLMDYNQGRGKGVTGPTPSVAAPSFGFGAQQGMGTSTPAFGQQPQQPATTNVFGQPPSTGLFGQPNNNAMGTTSMFGGASNTNTSTGGLFGANANKPSAFGASTSTPMFGQANQNNNTSGGLFGSSTPAQPAAGGFTFGANNNQQQPSTGFSFGANNTQAQNNQPKPLFGGFGSSTTQPSQPSTGFTFGSSTTQQPATTGFGAPSTGATGGGFSFGANNATSQAKPGGLFGSSTTAQPSAFGSFGSTNTAASTQQNKPAFSFGNLGSNTGTTSTPAFGAPNNTAGTGGGLFGAKPAGSTGTGTGFSFGQSNTSTQPPATTGFGAQNNTTGTGGGLFGAKPAGTSLFGNPAPSTTQPSTTGSTSLFGQSTTQPAQPAAGGLFGNNAPKPAFSFGSSTAPATTGTTSTTTTGGGGLFGQSQPAPSTGPSLFGQSQPAPSTNTGTSLFGAPKPLGASLPAPSNVPALPAQPPTLTTNPYGTDALLSSVSSTSAAANQAPLPFNVAPKNKPPLVSPFRSSPRNAVRVTRLRGSTPGLDVSRSMREGTPSDRATPLRAGSVSLFHQPSDAATLSPQAFIPRSTSKRLVLDGDTSISRSPSVLREGTPRASVAPRARFSPAVEKVVVGNTSQVGAGGDPDSSVVLPVRESSFTSTPPAPRAKSVRPTQHGDYYMEPSLATLRSMPFDELSCVAHFVVGRVGFGRVEFLEPVDLTSVPNLSFVAGGVVQLRAKECFVYPQEEDLDTDTPLDGLLPNYTPVPKAALGTGLNVPAVVSLEGCWPLDRATREPLRDESLPRVKQHITKLRNKKETTFVSYDAESGTWTFEVQHFSRYGLDDSDEEDEPVEEEDDDVVPPPMKLGDESDSGSSAMRESELMSGEEGDAPETDVWMPAVRATTSPAARRSMTPFTASRLDTPNMPEARKVQVMRASFFGQAPPTPGPVGGVTSIAGPPAPQLIEHKEEHEPMTEEVKDVEPEPVALTRVESGASVLNTALCADPGLYLAPSFRVGWASMGATLAHNGSWHDLPRPSWTQVHIDRLPVYKTAEDRHATMQTARKLLHIQLASTNITTSDAGVPCVAFEPHTTCAGVAQHYAADDKQYAAQLWHLASVLFDPIDLQLPDDASDAWVASVLQRRRKAAFSTWLEHAVSLSVQAEVRSHVAASRHTELIFSLLSGHQIEQAADAALDAGHVRLATLVAQAGGALETRADIQDQLDTWHAEGADADMQYALLRVYELLAGQVVSASVSGARARDKHTIAMARGLDWRRALGLHVWYGTPWESSLDASVRSYEEALRTSAGETVPPLPRYQADAQLGVLKQRELAQRTGAPRDALYELLKLHVDASYPLEHALDPRNVGPSALDHTHSWHLGMYLARALGVRTYQDVLVMERLTTLYATQLEDAHDWHWAAYVLLHLTDEGTRAEAVRALLARHVDDLDTHASFLTTTLHVDEAWLWQARALAAHARCDYYAEYECRRNAHDMSGAHAVAVRYLAAESFLRGDTQMLMDLFRPMAEEAESQGATAIRGWNEGGRVLLDFASLPHLLPPLLAKAQAGTLEASERHTLQQATVRTHELMDRVPLLYPDTSDLMSTVARSEMLAVLQNLSRLLASEAGAPEPIRHWTPSHPPEVEQLQAAARDFSSSMLACL